ncbi:MAG TPA: rod shape-determining protein MreC [Nevskiaceae bacterium]|nr:rod shape-determining protein MreC [Nevskiaceae bacterium]
MNTLSVSDHRHLFPRGPGLGLKTLLLLVLCGGLMAADLRDERLGALRSWGAWALTPVHWVATLPDRGLQLLDHLQSRRELLAENALLRERQLVLESRLQKMESLEAENRRIRELLASAHDLQEEVLIAEILAANQDPYRHQIMLNKGAADGVYRGQALVDAHGVLGQVVRVHPDTATALLITDPDHGIPVEINRTGLQTFALGRGDGAALRLPFLPGNADVQVGDELVSSALGGRFPAGYPVGRVVELRQTPGGHFKEAIAFPAARLNQGRQALLVWNRQPGENGSPRPADGAVAPADPAPPTAAPAAAPPP